MSGKRLHDLVDIEHVPLRFEGAGLYIDNIYIMNIDCQRDKRKL